MIIFQYAALANGDNRIRQCAIPLLVISFALVYPLPALVLASAVHMALKRIRRESSPNFAWSYIGAVIGGEAGIGLSYLHSVRCAAPGWNSYHYTLYPWLIIGLTITGAAVLSLTLSRGGE
ncbi:MAG: hypothetical protein JXA20_18840 [Spirochaetes bacterium]|nr:hypothetical protein [Spirochaetota bacterium]